MPQAKHKDSPGLSIEINSPKKIYRQGDIIQGRVLLNTVSDCALGSVKIEFYGRCKVKMLQNSGQSDTTYRSRANLFSVQQELYKSPYTFKPGAYDFPFSLNLPYTADNAVRGNRFKDRAPFVSTDVHDSLSVPLPPPTSYYHGVLGRRTFAFVEYVLAATVQEPQGLHLVRSPKTKSSIRPINFHPYSNPALITNHQLCLLAQQLTFRTLKLGLSDSSRRSSSIVSFCNLSRSIFQPSSLPSFSFNIAITYPLIIQVNHRDTIPFYLTLSAAADNNNNNTTTTTTNNHSSASRTRTNSLKPSPSIPASASAPSPEPQPPIIMLQSATITLHATTSARVPGLLGDMVDSKTSAIHLAQNRCITRPLPLTKPEFSVDKDTQVAAASTTEGGSGGTDNFINLGELFNLRVSGAQLSANMAEYPLVPSFASFNIARVYRLQWTLEFRVADKVVKATSGDVADADSDGRIRVKVVPGPEDDKRGARSASVSVERRSGEKGKAGKVDEVAEERRELLGAESDDNDDDQLPRYEA